MKFTSMKQIVASDRLKRFMDRRLIEALGHPFREHILAECNEGIVSATQIGEGIGADVSLFYKQMQTLERLGCIERVDSQPRRGATEHFFRATSTLFFDNEDGRLVPDTVKEYLALSRLEATINEASQAARAGVLNAGPDEHTSWTPARFDQQGWSEANQVLDEALLKIAAIKCKSAERLAERDERGISATVSLFGFSTGAPDQPSNRRR